MTLCTVETLIRTAALIHFSRNFGQNLLVKCGSYSSCGSYLRAALISVITVSKTAKEAILPFFLQCLQMKDMIMPDSVQNS